MKKYVTDINNNIYLKESVITKNKSITTSNVISINMDNPITSFLGFGSAITESSGYNYQKLSKKNKENFIKDYYGKEGLNFQFGRLSIGSNDFSLNSFSYSKKKNLQDFSISRDKEYVIPMLLDILKTKKISLIASPWSPPRVFKRLPILRFGIKLLKRHYDNYSNYLIKYLNEYQNLGINIDYITMQNEPIARQRWESCVFSLDEQKEFIYGHLLPKLKNTKVLLWDHNKDNLFEIFKHLYQENNKVAGLAFHYYTKHEFKEIKKIKKEFPNMLLINSEMCCSYEPYNERKWVSSAEYYLRDIIGDMNSGVGAYLDWNILLDKNGGPTHSKNYVKSGSVLIDNNYVKSPIYYYLYHISHFIDKDTKVIETTSYTSKLKVVALLNKKQLIVVIMNDNNETFEYNLAYKNKNINDSINPHSVITYTI